MARRRGDEQNRAGEHDRAAGADHDETLGLLFARIVLGLLRACVVAIRPLGERSVVFGLAVDNVRNAHAAADKTRACEQVAEEALHTAGRRGFGVSWTRRQ